MTRPEHPLQEDSIASDSIVTRQVGSFPTSGPNHSFTGHVAVLIIEICDVMPLATRMRCMMGERSSKHVMATLMKVMIARDVTDLACLPVSGKRGSPSLRDRVIIRFSPL